VINTDIARLQYQSIQSERVTSSVAKRGDDQKLREVCEDFEAIFVKQMLNAMKSTINKTGLNDGGFAEEIYDDMLYDEYAAKISKNAGLGIADSLYRQLAAASYK
jgi:peptidoglycan hydrolase FlgJ